MEITLAADDVDEAFWRPLSVRERASATALLTRAESMLIDQSPGLADRVDAETLSLDTVEQVILQAVIRVLTNPRGARSQSRTIDDYTDSITLDHAVSTGVLYFTTRELGQVSGTTGGTSTRGKAFTIVTGGPR